MRVLDASRPWLIYWSLHSLLTLGISLDSASKSRALNTLLKCQNSTGGFGGGPGQISHILTTYASIMSFVIAGGPGSGNGWEDIDRKGIYNFLIRMKQKDGSFIVHEGGEVDVSCQTYEGGFAACSQNGSQLGEAHGGYTSCALSALTMVDSTRSTKLQTRFDLDALIRWSVHMQGLESELGGFRGRTNKLVDGCYSWWLGGSFNLLEYWQQGVDSTVDDDDDSWIDEETCLYDREALQGYILNAAQTPKGGLRDKPGKNADTYHTAYNLSGLSASQHYIKYEPDRAQEIAIDFKENTDDSIPELENARRLDIRKYAYASAMAWMPNKAAKSLTEPGKFYVLQNALDKKPGKHCEEFLLNLMGELEESKSQLSGNDDLKDLVIDEDAANAYIENFALRVFIKADDLDRAGTLNKTVAQTFLASSYFLSLLTLFKNPPGDLQQKIKYARFKTTQIMNSLKNPPPPASASPRASTSALTSPQLGTAGLPNAPSPKAAISGLPSVPSPKVGSVGLPSVPSPKIGTAGLPPHMASPKPSPKHGTVGLPSPKQSPHPSLPSSPRFRSNSSLSQHLPSPKAMTSMLPTEEPQGIDPTIVIKAQKHAKWAISALNYEDKDTAINQLQLALESLTGT
ncbi:hypothetical protein E3Q23_03191 [Wallemia mellicola]|uniref:Terpenoid cyclases/Protein prenyltransferase n=1 Tax=Wallemia mellicola TaxID=1708541 RepID=A0A4T0TVE3_9BASI|nr:hypothetical protein E3Q23_03191 [Wallemia mellicola]TIC20325.1 terpenoid cyclases/Protein prenyltransferase [Wallemia mellicola]TIC69195.1 terpenoid cyclases/Protein prenyltransferase [Wallemia mellicola]